MEKLIIPARRPRRLILNISKELTNGSVAFPISVISVQMSMRKRMWIN